MTRHRRRPLLRVLLAAFVATTTLAVTVNITASAGSRPSGDRQTSRPG
ncbi:hypothetical protein [Streptomyces sp. DH10]|nr:hypothetical protein [Streptomyces sp. DH10]MDG9707408.1 hypothetical protein [Streptomyces sp. DH10]